MILDRFLLRFKLPLLILICAYLIVAHYLFLGFNSWDGLSYRVPPIVELVQHGDLGGWKFDYVPARHFYPFFELVHIPFLKAFGLAGLYFSFSLVLLPAAVISVYLFARELTGNQRWAVYSATAFLAIPFVNTQPFSGYVDFAVIGALAFFLYALLKAFRAEHLSRGLVALVALATFVFSMSRQHTPYVAMLLVGAMGIWHFLPWNESERLTRQGWANRSVRAAAVLLVFGVGLVPAAYLHVSRYQEFGTPIYPYRFEAFGIATPVGMTREDTARFAGLIAPDWRGLLTSSRQSWLLPSEWPSNFYDGRDLGAGALLWIALVTFAFLDEVVRRDTVFVLVVFAMLAVAVQDFWLPRWSMTLILALVVIIGGALAWFAATGPRPIYLVLALAVGLHLVRPVYDAYGMVENGRWYIRANLADSPLFIDGEVAPGVVEIYPDLNADLQIVGPVNNEFMLPLYGRRLSNRIVDVSAPDQLGSNCSVDGRTGASSGRDKLIIDQRGTLAGGSTECEWICQASGDGGCLAGKLISREG